jgi:hypothetical protein
MRREQGEVLLFVQMSNLIYNIAKIVKNVAYVKDFTWSCTYVSFILFIKERLCVFTYVWSYKLVGLKACLPEQ